MSLPSAMMVIYGCTCMLVVIMCYDSGFLILDDWFVDLRLARRLPADLAWRFRALPLAEEQGQITVAMAEPCDSVARAALVEALEETPYFVRGDPEAIETALEQVWGERLIGPQGLVANPEGEVNTAKIWVYGPSVGGLLKEGRMGPIRGLENLTAEEVDGCRQSVIASAYRAPAMLRRPLSATTTAREPSWPLRRILLLVCGEASDAAAVDWIVRLALLAGSAVTVLAVVPPTSATQWGCASEETELCIEQSGTRMWCRTSNPKWPDRGLATYLVGDTPMGRHLRHITRRLVQQGVNATLRLRQGSLDQQIRREIAEVEYDLVVVADQLHRWFEGYYERALLGANGLLLVARQERDSQEPCSWPVLNSGGK